MMAHLKHNSVVVDEGELKVERGSGLFIPREKPSSAEPLGRRSFEADLAESYGLGKAW